MLYKIKDIIKFCIAYIWSLFLKRKKIWIISERKTECKDNGYHLFKYIRINHPSSNTYYVIEKKSEQLKKILQYDNVIYFNSIKHYAYSLSAKKLIGAFLPVGIPESIILYKFPQLIKGKKVFLQHGITKEKIKSLMFDNTKLDLFICGAKLEYDFIKTNFNYPINNVKYTGFSRFDALRDESKSNNYILFMPTWRQYISSQTWGDVGDEFADTRYYKHISSFLNNENLIKILIENNINLIFYPHHEVQGKFNLFSFKCKNIIVASEKEYDVQHLLKGAKLLITDYSSVSFDFAYMNKPIIYYQFDEEEYYAKHYSKGYFDYEKLGFGVKVTNQNDLIGELHQIIENNFENKELFQERINNFFILRDNCNCKRIFNEIYKL